MWTRTRTPVELEAMSPADIVSVAQTRDPLFRNELITHNYWRIAYRFYRRFGESNVVWPTFGSWASAQAGVYMRLGASPWIRAVTRDQSHHVTDLLGRGNQLIFQDIAPGFSNFLDWAESRTDAELRDFLRGPGVMERLAQQLRLNTRTLKDDPAGEMLLVMAFEQYLRGVLESEADARAERIFVANACVGLQEQTRVDCMLDLLLDVASVNDAFGVVLKPLGPGLRGMTATGRRVWPKASKMLGPYRLGIDRDLRGIARLTRAIVEEGRVTQVLGTQLFLELKLNGQSVDLSDDLSSRFAPGLEEISLTTEDFRRSFECVSAWDRTANSTDETAAIDWSDLSDRMNFIVDLFRTRQGERSLIRHPLAP